MKQHLSHYSVWIIACLLLGVNLHAQEVKPVTVHVEKAGTLPSLIDPAMKYQITNLTVTGELNGTDIRYIRLMAGSADTITHDWTAWTSIHSMNGDRIGVDPEATKKFNKEKAEQRAASFQRGDTIEGKLSILDLSGATIVSGGEDYLDSNKGSDNKGFRASDGDLGNYMFSQCESLTSVVLPNNMTELPNNIFYYCKRLTSVTLPKDLTIIRSNAFDLCYSLASITFPESLERIESAAFSYCKGLTSLVLPTSVTAISSFAFRGCTGLTSLVVPNNVTRIEPNAFSGCTGLASVTMPDESQGISEGYTPYLYIFKECVGMKEIHVYPTNPKYNSVDGILFSKDGKTLIAYPMGRSGEYTIPEGVTSIGKKAFENCAALTSFIIPNSVTEIGESAFESCDGLTSIITPNSVTEIGESAFSKCIGLTSVSLSENIAVIPKYCFSECSSLSAITIPGRVTSIGHAAFMDCKSLTSIHIPESVTQIEPIAFIRCEKLASVTLPNAAIVADDSFCGCALLKEFVVSSDNPLYCTVDGVLFSKDKKTLLAFPAGKSKSYMIPDGVTTIGASAFSRCKELTSVTLPKSVTTIGVDAFFRCTGLTSLILPKSLTSFGYRAIYGCNSLKKIYCKSFVPPVIDKTPSHTVETFGEDPELAYRKSCVLYVPNRAVKAYSLANEWSSFVHISGE